MQTEIQRQYDEVIASRYDYDPQGLTGKALDRAVDMIQARLPCGPDELPLKVLDLGCGTGLWLEKLRTTGVRLQPFGLDLSRKMVEVAHARIPDLVSEVDDAARLDDYFPEGGFDVVGTHFITGFVPLKVLAPKVHQKLAPGGLWSVMGATRGGFPELQRKATSAPCRWLFGTLDVAKQACVPADQDEVARTLQEHGYTIRHCDTLKLSVGFANFREFLEFAYYGGWLTPFIEAVGLHQAGRLLRFFMDSFFFPVQDHHTIFLVLGEKS